MTSAQPRGPVDSSRIPRYAGPATFARLPRLDEVGTADVAVLGVPVDAVIFSANRVYAGNHSMSFAEAAKLAWQQRVSLSAAGFYRTPDLSWDPKTMSISTAPSAGLPDYLHLQPTLGAGPAAG